MNAESPHPNPLEAVGIIALIIIAAVLIVLAVATSVDAFSAYDGVHALERRVTALEQKAK